MLADIFEWLIKKKKTVSHFRKQNRSLTQDACCYAEVVDKKKKKKDVFSVSGTEPVTDTGCLLLFLSGQ